MSNEIKDSNGSNGSITYAVIFEQEDDGGFSAYVPDLRGCASQGDTMEEARANIAEAIEGYLLALKDDGIAPPAVRTFVASVPVSAPAT